MAELPKDHFRRCVRPFYLAGREIMGRRPVYRKKSLRWHLFSPAGKGPVTLAVSIAVALLALLLAVQIAPAPPLPPPAFPGAEGFGSMSVGGRGGSVIEVTNLNDSGPGSLRAAIEATGPRTVVFRSGGTVELNSPLIITAPYITIAGQTAPGGGITLKNGTNTNTSLSIQTHDVIIRYLRVRPGPGGDADGISILYNQSYNVILDHCSVSWAVDENISTWYDAHDISIQWCLISEALNFSTHSEGPHSMGALFGSSGSHSVSIHHNLFVHNDRRNPNIKTSGLVDFVNNVINNYGNGAGDLVNEYGDLPVNYVGNYVKWGQDSDASEYEINLALSKNFDLSVYVHGNIGPHRPDETYDEAAVVSPEDRQFIVGAPYPAPLITTTSAQEAYEIVLANAGATIGIDGQGRGYWRRDPVDIRLVNDVRNNTGRIIDDPYDVGGWPVLEMGVPPADSDHDGMPDEWEELNGFDPVDPTDGPADADGDGYTNLEVYLASLSLPDNQPPGSEAGPDQMITLPDNAALSGIVSDDGQPDPPGVVTAAWSQVSGPGTATFADANALATSAGFSTAGTYVLRLTADDGQLATSDEMTVFVTGAGGEFVTEVQVAAGSDDAEETPTGNVSLTSSDLELGADGGRSQTVGMRFADVDIPQGAAIVDAYIQFTVDETDSVATSVIFRGEAADNAAVFNGTSTNITSRSPTAAEVTWEPVPWTTVGTAGQDQRTPSLASIIQEIVNRPGWVVGNALVILVAGTGERTAESYDGNSRSAPLLHVVYNSGGGSGGDTTPPMVTGFDLPDETTSLTVPILTFTATDDNAVTGYLATESSTTPAAGDPGWQATAPTEHTFSAEGSQTLYGWARDAAGNVSTSLNDTVAITLPDTTAPVVTGFDLPDTSDSLTVPISTFTASDNLGVTGYLAIESATAPLANDPGWSDTPPTEHSFGAPGAQTLYGWARDAAGNISTSLSDTVAITLADTEAPVVTAFDLPATSVTLTVPITSFTASDNIGVTGYLATESATAPAAGDPGWSASVPTSHTFSAEGTQTLYGWARDAAGNVSASLSDTVTITLPDAVPPVVTAFDLPATADSLSVPIVSFTATDDTGVTGYLATESATAPAANDPGWSGTAPTEHTFGAPGAQALYGWAKDAAGNVSASLNDTVTITLPDTTAPVVTGFDLPETSASLTVPILTFTASDNLGVTGYLATESSTAPAAGDPGWQATAPTEHTFSAPGARTLYGWAKDPAGNISTSLNDTVTITLVTTMHVGDLDGSVRVRGKSGKWVAFVRVAVHDQSHNPVAGAVVNGTWGGAANGTVSGTTDGSGAVTFGTGTLDGGSTITFGVTGASLGGSTYDAGGNHDPDGDSDGTSLTVSRP